ncbi:MAG TPA: NAD-dependent protein deacetylase [Woeseiaceae bacterium]|nr:NAD-dependent protein deacetylase [Woeseiaceae bacterium]
MPNHILELAGFLGDSATVAVLTGAGVSTASGIPGYRDQDGNWRHAKPVQFADFIARPAARQRYWARSYLGWRRFARAAPNAAHRALARLEAAGAVDTLVTQNVDGLHQLAGSRAVVDLHGRLDAVRCLECGLRVPRAAWQARLEGENAAFEAEVTRINPDGDVELGEGNHAGFVVPDCPACGGVVKPDVVFFGEAVPRERVGQAMGAVERAGALLVVGSSLMVWSGLRFVRRAAELGKPVAIVNRGRTRADELATLRIDAGCEEVLPDVVALVAGAAATPRP